MSSMHQELLKNFKELFDEGLITEAEYLQKKNEVLGMAKRASNAPVNQYQAVPPSVVQQARAQQAQSLSIDQILAELGDDEPVIESGMGGATTRRSINNARPSAHGGGTVDDLDYFVEMLAGSEKKEKASVAMTTDNSDGYQATSAPARPVANARPAAKAVEKFINAEHQLVGHKGFVFDVAVEVSSSRLFTSSADNSIGVWDLSTMQLTSELRAHTNNVYCLALDEETGRLFSGSWDNTVRVWSTKTLKELRCLKDATGYVSSLTIADSRLFAGSWDKLVRVYDLRTLKLIDTLSLEHTGVIYDVIVHKDMIFTASQDGSIRTWSNRTYNYKDCCGEVGGGQHTDWVLCLVGHGDRLFSASRDKSIKVWDVTQKHIKPIHLITGHQAAVTWMLVKGSYLISGDGKGVVKIWHVDTYDCVDTIQAHPKWIYRVRSIGDYIFTCGKDKTIKVWS